MSADAADKFEGQLEGEDFGSMDDWESDLGLKILKIESKLITAAALADANRNVPVINMLRRKLATYNASLMFIDENSKAATALGQQGGLQAIIAYITKQAVEDVAKAETRKYSNIVAQYLPGYRISRAVPVQTGLISRDGARAAPANANLRAVGAINGSDIILGAS